MKVAMEGSFNAVVSSAVRRSVEEAVSYSGYTMPDVSFALDIVKTNYSSGGTALVRRY